MECIDYYPKNCKEFGLPEPISFSDNFLLWAPDRIKTDVFIYLNNEPGDLEWAFEIIVLKGQIDNKYFREDGTQVCLCSQARETFPVFYAEKVALLKDKYRK